MRRQRHFIRLTLVVSILIGIILPLALGVNDPTYIAIFFTLVWVIYALFFLIQTFHIAGRRNIKTRLEELVNDKWGFS